ncbi:hypothetical protein CIB87_16850 [Priestia megaterium]|uniref:Uncharacterized protein n=1 Tax=Priestia megaterium TaxID=1404 RepID=A0AA86I5D2_PRIMG|nr:hypothetical protein [Priestia megaterium]AXI30609.1 hypothetical protein CIB87_16850 [Priestia megaterium]
MILKAIDLSLMSEHLMTHKGVLKKLAYYYCSVKNPILKQIIYEQFLIMRNHVYVMLELMDPEHNEDVSILALNQVELIDIPCPETILRLGDKNILLEAHNTAKSMALDNFSSALKMKATNVKSIHVQMALQQVQLEERYSELGKMMGLNQSPDTSSEEQTNTIKRFKRLFHL